MFKQSSMLVAVLVLGLAAVAMSAQVEQSFGSIVCDACKTLVAQSKDQIPQVKPQLEQLCNYCGSEANTKKCLDAIDKAIDQIEHQTPEDICAQLRLCKKDGLNSIFGF